MSMSPENLAVLADMTVRLLELRQNECKNLVVEDSAPILFGKLVGSYLDALAKEVPTTAKVVSVTNRVDLKSLLGRAVFPEAGS
ncbi:MULTISPECIES: hypothetical protein [Pseudomonas]|uniref:Uncharacterized protein n=2 Tax=root TaxID=1 RepID=A0A0A1IUZ1_9CAUD|nr:hypothetical protein [Pseudomonas aeruginosa]YP_009125669.1 hypothetical protein VC49_gp30 [Pseudomonas phage vB_PaeS_PAO1_Ab30]QBI81150.1 hypothetical protein [Pseudomonas phage vB_Pae_CF28a]QBI82201.1 hypothetical protein [Pseudomonas phage vB_Pae_BR327a]UNY48436.1 hypothetical protein [Pseudomonas phage WX_01]AWE97053.1 hypothetical protein CSC26_3926 [Pseudomonas aeruginosa]AWF01530.1 hypothetical protein CSC26_3418 [Pseudomonas aeruginosa]